MIYIKLIYEHLKNIYMSYLIAGQKTTAIWSGNFLVFHSDLGGQLVRHRKYVFWFVLFCFGATVV